VVLLLLVWSAANQLVQGQTYTVLHSFSGADGASPYAGLTLDSAGNLYGTTLQGGAFGAGTVFKLDSAGNESVLHSFTGGADGGSPRAGVILDSASNLYGTTANGGASNLGTVFKLDQSNQETVLHNFGVGHDGRSPWGGLLLDSVGNLYGTTVGGGAYNWGTIFRVNPNGSETVIRSFTGVADGADPRAELIRDSAGNFYGTTLEGGIAPGWGTIFKLDPSGTKTVLYSFAGGNGRYPWGGLVRDSKGNLYGTTSGGGNRLDYGTVFKLNKFGKKAVLHRFTGGADGYWPVAGLVRDPAGNLYGTTLSGGTSRGGTVFKLDPARTETVLHTFTGRNDGGRPNAGLIQDSAGNLYGTASEGGTNNLGVVFKITR